MECEFCHTAFTVQVQPEFAAFPQTIDGMPVDVPGMPGQIDSPPPLDPNAMGADPMDPDAVEDPSAEDVDEDESGDWSGPPSGANQPPWLKGKASLKTTSGTALEEEEYLNHLAVAHADDRESILADVRRAR